MSADPGLGPVGSWILVATTLVLGALVVAAALAAVTFATRGTPFRRVRALDDRIDSGAGGCRADERIDGMSPLPARSEEFCDVARVLATPASGAIRACASRGPAVEALQGAFVANWAEATGDLLLGNHVFPFETPERGSCTAGLLYLSPSLGSTSAERFFVTSIAAARERCWLSTGYFVPDRYLRRLLCEAAGRGVDVRVLTPGGNTDRPSTWYAARAHYEELLRAGVRLHEYRPTMMHAKTLVVDGIWGMIGTLNFDNRSLVLNDEVGLLFHDTALGQTLEAAFRADLEHANEMTIAGERSRTDAGDRVRSFLAGRVSRLL